LLEPKLPIARTKYKSKIVNCIAPMFAAELRQKFDKANFVSVAIDG